MKLSNYNIETKVEDNYVIYNTLSRKYVIYNDYEKENINELLKSLNQKRYELKDAEIIKKLMKNRIVINEEFDEFGLLSCLINKTKFTDKKMAIVIVPTRDCNFRCGYCFEDHKNIYMDQETMESLIRYVDDAAKKVKFLQIGWFGGEPMLEYDKIYRLSKSFQESCKKAGCKYQASITSNGYLFSENTIDELVELGITHMQITLDGDKECHNKSRPLSNGNGSFDRVLFNLIKILDKDIEVTLRINVYKDNIHSVPMLLEKIPIDKRRKVNVTILNLFQAKDKINQLELYKAAVDMGYKFNHVSNTYEICEANLFNSFIVQPDGKVTGCQTFAEKGIYYGNLEMDGKMNINNSSEYIKIKYTSALNNENCTKCNLLPICMGGCVLQRYYDKDRCVGRKFDGMSIEDIAKLHIYYDLKHNLVQDVNIL